MRWPGSSAAPWAARYERTNATVVAGSSVSLPSATTRAVLGHGRHHGQGVDAGDLVAEDHAAVADVAGEHRLDVVEGDVEVDQLERRAEPGDGAVVADPDGHLDLDRGRHPAGERDGGAVGLDDAGVGEVADDGVGQPEVLLDGRRVEADLPADRCAPPARSASRRASSVRMPRETAAAASGSGMGGSLAPAAGTAGPAAAAAVTLPPNRTANSRCRESLRRGTGGVG